MSESTKGHFLPESALGEFGRFRGWSQLIDATLYFNKQDGVFKMSNRSRIYFTSEQRRTLTQLYKIVVIVALQPKINNNFN
jgi:hypothetical protein